VQRGSAQLHVFSMFNIVMVHLAILLNVFNIQQRDPRSIASPLSLFSTFLARLLLKHHGIHTTLFNLLPDKNLPILINDRHSQQNPRP